MDGGVALASNLVSSRGLIVPVMCRVTQGVMFLRGLCL